ncbi:MAG: hypothetical protein K1Y36_19735 [Blastocatellia bacterium]|nr:hypothetical protein [Blastocatellia bacterium]
MSNRVEVLITVLPPTVEENSPCRTALCQLRVESKKSLPRAPYSGTVRVAGVETTITGRHPCRLLKHYTVEFLEALQHGGLYQVSVDLSDELPKPPVPNNPAPDEYVPFHQPQPMANPTPGLGVKELAEPLEAICKRIAGVFGRYCEEFRPPTVAVNVSRSDEGE